MYTTDRGVVLLSRNYSDSDKLLKVFSSNYGVITVLGKGVRKLTSRRSYSLDTLNYISANYYKKDDFYYVRDVSLIDNFTVIKSNITIVSWVYYILEVLEQIVLEGEQETYLYQNLVKTLQCLNQEPKKRELYRFLKKVLQTQGYFNNNEYKQFSYLKKLDSNDNFTDKEKILLDNYFQERLEAISERKIHSVAFIKSL